MVLICPVEQHEPPNPPIKVKLSSRCIKCHLKLKKKVQKIQGVEDVKVVPERGGIVIISGSCIDINVLMEVIRKNYKNAEILCSLNIEEPSKQKDGNNNLSCIGDHGGKDHKKEEDSSDSHLPVKNLGNDARSISQASEEKKMKKKGWIMRIFEKKSNPRIPRRPLAPGAPPPPGTPQTQTDGQANHGPFCWESRPTFRPEMQLRPPNGPVPPFWGLPPPPPPPPNLRPPPPRELMPAGYRGHPFPMSGYGGQPYPMSPPRLNPMVHYTNYSDNYPPPPPHHFRY